MGAGFQVGRGMIAVVVIVFSFAVPAPASATEPAFCEEIVLRDYLKPLDRLPALRRPNADGSLGFGPERLRVSFREPLVVGEGAVGFSLDLEYPTGPVPVRPGWRFAATLSEVDGRGRAIEVVKRWRRTINVVRRGDAAGFWLEVGEPGVYRFSVGIRNKDGKRLGGFGYYARVVAPTEDARLAITPGPYRPGDTVLARIENLATSTVHLGVDWALDRFNGSGWERAPESPRGPWILPLYSAMPGQTSNRCVAYQTIAPSMSGRYRLVKEIGYQPGRSGPTSPLETPLTAEFEVTP